MDGSDGKGGRGRRRRRSRRRRRPKRRRRRRRKRSRRSNVRSTLSSNGGGLAKALLGPELGALGVKHKSGRKKRRRRRKRVRGFGANLDIENMADNFFEDSEIDTEILSDFGSASMNNLFDTMSLENNFEIANGQQLKKCKLFSM